MEATNRQYLTIALLESFADITVTDNDEAYQRIQMAEEMIDQYVGAQAKSIDVRRVGLATSVSGKTLYDISSDTPLDVDNDYLKFCVLEIVGGGGAGAIRPITSSSKTDKSVTYTGASISGLTTDSAYRVYQMGKFPRRQDVNAINEDGTTTWYKSIPEAVQRAAAAQVEYMIELGDDFFKGQQVNMDSESIGNYSYSRGKTGEQSATVKFLAPKARLLLRGIMNRKGRMVA